MSAATSQELTVLYVPNLVPSETWLKKTLLHANRVSTMVSGYGFQRSDLLMDLEQRGFWEPANLDTLDSDTLRDLSSQAITVAEQIKESRPEKGLPVKDRVLAGKLPELLEGYLVENGHLERLENDGTRLGSWSAALVPNMLTLCAATFAEARDWRFDVRTDQVLHTAVSPLSNDEGSGVAAMLKAMPNVAADVPLEVVLKFRQDHPNEFAAYRHHLTRVEEISLDLGNSPEETIKELRAAIRELQRAAELRDLPWQSRALRWVGQLRSPEKAVAAAAIGAGVAAQVTGLESSAGKYAATAAALGLSLKAVRVRRKFKAVAYLHSARSSGILAPK